MFAVTKRTLAVVLAAGGLVSSAGLGAAALTQDPDVPLVREATKVTICHATRSEKNPYVQISVDDDSIVKENGHGGHPDDIIPPFDYVEGGVTKHYPGLNWNADGRAIWDDGCEVPPPPPQPIQPSVKCVDANGSTFKAVFGYTNPNAAAVTIAVGPENAFVPGPVTGQPTTFQPGTVESAVTVTGASDVTWTVSYGGEPRTATATASFPTRCSTTPPPGPAAIEVAVNCVDNSSGTFSVDFRYVSAANGVVTIPASANSFSPDVGQSPPSEFLPGEHVFTITGIPNGTKLVWTLTTDTTRTAEATAEFPQKCNVPPTPKPISVSVTCIEPRGTTFDATFGYVNPNGTPPVEILVGPNNHLTIGGAESTGQPTTFAVGTVTNAFTVPSIAGADVEWSVTYAGKTTVAVADKAFPTKCSEDPPDPPGAYRIGVFVSCVTNQGSTYSATFGYSNEDTEANTVPIGDANRFFPAPEGRGQPTSFKPGNVQDSFTVTGIPAQTPLVWSLTSDETRTADATASFPTKCGTSPDPPPAELVPIGVFVTCVTNHANTYDAVFGYENDNRAEQIIPVGLENAFSPSPGNRGQPTTFEPGTVRNAVAVTGIPNGSVLVWRVDHVGVRAAVANEFLAKKCEEPPPPLPEPPPNPRPPESGLSATCVLRQGLTRTYDAIFGYANASQKQVTIPVGRRNLVTPRPIDRGQPSVFRPGIVLNAFAVRNVPRGRDLTWAVRLPNGEIRTTTVSARFPRNCITAPAPQTADLVLRKTVPRGGVFAGQRVTYTIDVTNRGPNIALRVRIVDVVDPRLELLSASSTRGRCTTSGQRVSCTIAELPPGAITRVIVAVRPRSAGTIANVARVTHSRRDPTPRNNVDRAVIHVDGRAGGLLPAFTG